jgi:hypothetical protein
MRRSLLEDAALELTACGSPMLVWWSGGAAALVLRLASMGKAVMVFCARGFLCLGSALVLQLRCVGGADLPVAIYNNGVGLLVRCVCRFPEL